jgi:hypothetical protein
MSQGEEQLHAIIQASTRWAQTTEPRKMLYENAEQIAYLRECLEKRPGLPHHLLKAGVMRTLATTQQQIAFMVSYGQYQDAEQAALCAQARPSNTRLRPTGLSADARSWQMSARWP